MFRSHSPLCLASYADNLEIDGTFGETAQRAWAAAGKAWEQFSTHQFVPPPASWFAWASWDSSSNFATTAAEFEALSPGLSEKIRQGKARRAAAAAAAGPRYAGRPASDNQHKLAALAHGAESAFPPTKSRAASIRPSAGTRRNSPTNLMELDEKLDDIRSDRGIVNFDYWKLRAEVEQSANSSPLAGRSTRGIRTLPSHSGIRPGQLRERLCRLAEDPRSVSHAGERSHHARPS